jgi:putative spermidine/putrescine transport system permease protein
VLLFIFVAPLVFVVIVNFFDCDRLALYSAFMLDNYAEIFTSAITLKLYLKTFEYASLVEAITIVVGFLVAYFLTSHVRTLAWRIGLLVACTIRFFISNMIRMISLVALVGVIFRVVDVRPRGTVAALSSSLATVAQEPTMVPMLKLTA